MTLIRPIAALAFCVFSASAAAAAGPKIHMGLTIQELAAFGQRSGWSVESINKIARSLYFRIPTGSKNIVWSIRVQLEECDKSGRCNVAVVSTFRMPPQQRRQAAYWWNVRPSSSHAYGANRLSCASRGFYMRLHQAIYLRGVTDTYLKEMVDKVWARNMAGFKKYLQRLKRR